MVDYPKGADIATEFKFCTLTKAALPNWLNPYTKETNLRVRIIEDRTMASSSELSVLERYPYYRGFHFTSKI